MFQRFLRIGLAGLALGFASAVPAQKNRSALNAPDSATPRARMSGGE